VSDQLDERPLLQIRNLTTQAGAGPGLVTILDDVSLTVRRGHNLGIVGESGSGKSMLARSVLGLLPPGVVASGGQIVLDGVDLPALDARQRRAMLGKQVSIIFQNPMSSLHPVMKVWKQIAEVLIWHRIVPRSRARSRAIELLDEVRIPDAARVADQYPHELSGGMQQRVMIAIAIACGPKLLLADEPTTALDVTVQKQVLDLLDELQASGDMTVVLVSHDLSVIAQRCDDLAVMYGGRILEEGHTDELFRSPRSPYTAALLESIPRLNGKRRSLPVIAADPREHSSRGAMCVFAPRCLDADELCWSSPPALQHPATDSDTRTGTGTGAGAGAAIETDTGRRVACWHPRRGLVPARGSEH
jgi:peptide/nickel transport system ATP-binding protein